jgi:non-homologous end joining protein Ku
MASRGRTTVAVRPHERGIVMYPLHHAAEIRSIDAVEELNSVTLKRTSLIRRKRHSTASPVSCRTRVGSARGLMSS